MKKYLMIGFAAVAFAACSNHDFETTTQADIDKAKYDQAFISYIGGRPAANQDWGFGATTRAFTRADINVNGNMWQSCPELGSTEEADVVAYVTGLNPKPNTNPIQLQNYYVTQVHCGTEIYYSADGGAGIIGSGHMDHLQIAMESDATITNGVLSDGWQHINNFNRGDNTDWKGNTLVTSGGTFDFAYNGSEDSKYHNRWIAIDGKNVPKTGGGNYDGNYYVCFDFEATVSGYTLLTNASYFNPYLDNGNGQWLNFNNIQLPGKWTAEDVANSELVYEVDLYDQNNNFKEHKVLHFNNPEEIKNISVGNFVGGNQAINPNSSYLDWIVRLVKAEPKADPNVLRIIAEDLSATQASDFDFNDVVLDVTYGNPATVMLVAAGGQLQLKVGSNNGVGGVEVHEALLGADNAKNGNVYKMVSPGGNVWPVDAVDITSYLSDTNIQNAAEADSKIRIEVFKNGAWELLTAPKGEPSCKLAVDQTFGILRERDSIKDNYEFFVDWAKDNNFTSKWWTIGVTE